MISRSALAIVTGSILATLVVGCAASEPDYQDVRVSADTSATPLASPPLTAGICPDPAYSTEPAPYYQAKATSVVGYLFGGVSPFTKKELDGNPECKASLECATLLRDQLYRGGATLHPALKESVCGLAAAVYAVDIAAQLSPPVWDAIASCGARLDGCWGIGVSGFYHARPDQKGRGVYIDPEPARLSQNLTGSTGATAAAVYTSSGGELNAVKWPGSYTSSASPPPAGTPCATGDLPEGYETLKILQGSGAYRRCF
jgi:hypothetical protein